MLRTLADRLMLFPSKGPDAVEGVRREEIPFNDGILEMWSGRSAAASAKISREVCPLLPWQRIAGGS